jgi:1-acyl-sn-glycerol-3-phosphate acyltransferase
MLEGIECTARPRGRTGRRARAASARGRDLGHDARMSQTPPRPTPLSRAALGLLHLAGWRGVLVWPPEPHGVIMVYPHTSNWDFVFGMLFRIGHGLPANWVGKKEMFPKPIAGLLARLGGIPVDRRRANGFIETLLEEYRRRDWMWVAITPEGTRSHAGHIKSGFYQLAVTAGVPVGLGYVDYATRTVGIDTYLHMSGDRDADLARIRDFYADKRGRHPELAGELRLRR